MFARVASAWPGSALLLGGACARLARAGRRPAGRRLCGHRLPAGGRRAAHADAVARIAFRTHRIRRASRRSPRARAAARRAGAGDGEPRGDRRELLADGGDGDHGGLVPQLGGRLARHGAARGPVPPHQRTRARPGWIEPALRSARARRCRRSARAEFLRSAPRHRSTRRGPRWRCSRATASRATRDIRFPSVGADLRAQARRSAACLDERRRSRISTAIAAGTRIELPLAGRQRAFVVAGVWRDYARQHGVIVIERETYAALSGDRRANDAALWLAPGASAAALTRGSCARCRAAGCSTIAQRGRDPPRSRWRSSTAASP